MKVGQRSLLGYLPAQVIKCVLDGKIKENQKYPFDIPLKTVSLFADISGFTKLSEKFSKKGRIGPEFLAFSLNRYMELLINIIGKNGGDIFKFAGDALLVIWPATGNSDLEEYSVRALNCAKQIQKKLNNLDMGIGNRLCVKVGLGVGECSMFYVGGTFKRSEYLIVGSAMKQACSAECHALSGGQIIVSEKMYNYIKDYFQFSRCEKDKDHPDSDDMAYYLYIEIEGKQTMKPVMLWAIIALAAIAIVASFGFQLGPTAMPEMSESLASNILFVCPITNLTWDSISFGLVPFMRYIVGGFFFTAVLLLFGWGWQLYQNLLNDKFKRDSFKNIWGFTKIWFWALVVVMLLFYTPGTFRRVEITGADGNWVLCEGNNPNARAVHASAIHAR